MSFEELLEEGTTSSPGVEGEDGEKEEEGEAEEESFEGGGRGRSWFATFWKRVHGRGVHVDQRDGIVRHGGWMWLAREGGEGIHA